MTYFMAAGVVLWVLFRRIMFKVWWAVAVFAFTLPVGAHNVAPYVKLELSHGDLDTNASLFWHSQRIDRMTQVVTLTGGVGHFYLSTDPTSESPGYLRHSIVVSKVNTEWCRVDIWGPLIHLTTYRMASAPWQTPSLVGVIGEADGEEGWLSAPDPSIGYPDGEGNINTLIATSRAPDGEEAAYGDVDFDDPAAEYWLKEIFVSNTAFVPLPSQDDDDIADPTSAYFPGNPVEPDTTQSEMFAEIESSFDASELQPYDDSEDFRDEVLHEDLIPEFDLPEDVDALKVCISSAMTSLLGNAAWEYNSPTYGSHNDYDTSSFATTLFGEGDMYPFLVFAFVDALEVAHVEWGPWFAALRAFLTLCFTISVLFMIIRLALWSFGIVNPFGSAAESVEAPEYGSSYAEGT